MSKMSAPLIRIAGHWCHTAYSYEAADALDRHLRPGGPVRMAILLHLAAHPDGVTQAALWSVVLSALPARQQAPSMDDMQVLCGHLHAEGLMAVEHGHADGIRYFNPVARKSARLRRLHGHVLPMVLQPGRAAAR